MLKIIIYIVSFILLYIFLPVYLASLSTNHPVFSLLIFYLANALVISYAILGNQKKRYRLRLNTQDLQEKINIISDENSREIKNRDALEAKIKRYDGLKNIIEEINQDLVLESIADSLSKIAFSSIADNRGTCLLYLTDRQTQTGLGLFKTKKEDKKLIIKAKEGDIFDHWVLRHSSPLLVEDIRKDFRFDVEKLKAQGHSRPISCLISSPFISGHRFLGILRLDSPEPRSYSQDDLRFLVTICDIGAVALENGEYFEETQDLAIHDELTSLYTKGYFLERLNEECKRSMRQNRAFSLLMLDIDYFKNYNDRLGHTAGDIVLKTLSQNIMESLKDSSTIISRFGGEEFCVILPSHDKAKAKTVADQLRTKIEKASINLRRQQTNVTVSIGVATFPDDATDENELVIKADKAMYEAKQKGRNQVCMA